MTIKNLQDYFQGNQSLAPDRYPLVLVVLAYGAGIFIGRLTQPPLYLLIPALAFFLGLTLFFCSHRSSKDPLYPLLFTLFFLGAFRFALSSGYFPPTHLDRIPGQVLEGKMTIEGIVAQPPERLEDDGLDEEGRTRLVLDRVRILGGDLMYPSSGRVRLTVGKSQTPYSYGDRIKATLRLRRPRGFLNPGAFDYRSYRASQGIYLEGWVGDESTISKDERKRGNPFFRVVFDLRQRMLERLEKALPEERAAFLKAIILGDRSSLPSGVNEAFLGSGTYHILAISGLHVGLLAGAFFFALRILRVPRKTRAFLCLVLVNFYALLAGANPSVVRAALMISLYLLAIILDREANLWNTLALAALVLLLWNPWYLFDVGFQLTFSATAAIIVAFSVVKLDAWPRPWRWPLGSILISLSATLATLPLLALYFNRFSLIGVIANLPIVPLTGVLTGSGMLLSLTLLFFPEGLGPLNWLNSYLIGLLFYLARLFASFPLASIRPYTPTYAMVTLYYALLISMALGYRAWAKKAASFLAISLSALIGLGLFYNPERERLRVTFIDVGQGDSALLELPGGKTMLIDGGGVFDDSFDIGEKVVASYLWYRWIGRLDVLVLSHPHPDHLNGLRSILQLFKVGEVWDAGQPYNTPAYLAFQEELRRRKIPYRILERGFEYQGFRHVSISVLHPPRPFLVGSERGSFSDENSNSLVLRVKFGEVAFLFPGDVEIEAEEEILRKGVEVQAQVIKVPHHGGRTSSSPVFLEKVGPGFAIVSAGFRNPFRQPHQEALERYKKIGAELYRTNLNGAVTVTTNGRRIWIKPYIEPSKVYP